MFGPNIEVVRNHPIYGGHLTIPDDTREYGFQPGQKFVPHVIADSTHPAMVGDTVVLTDWLAGRLGISVATVSGVRTLKDSKRSNGNRQVELLGLPCRWFSIGHFEEY